MEETVNNSEQENQQNFFTTVTPFSKYSALVLFIILPFIGFWLGYRYAPNNIVEVEKVVMEEKVVEMENIIEKNDIQSESFAERNVNTDITLSKQKRNPEASVLVDSGETVLVNLNELKQTGGYYYLDDVREKIYYVYKTTEIDVSPGEQIDVYLKDTYITDIKNFSLYENDDRYAHDSLNVYGVLLKPWEWEYEFAVVDNADYMSFKPNIVKNFDVPQGNTFQSWISKDKNSIYYKYDAVEGVDTVTFEITEHVPINRDANNVYLWWKVLPEADPGTYEVVLHLGGGGLGDVYGKDKKFFFVNYCKMEGVDAETVNYKAMFSLENSNVSFYDKNGEFEVDYNEESNTCSVVR